jgi:hypothetical protein
VVGRWLWQGGRRLNRSKKKANAWLPLKNILIYLGSMRAKFLCLLVCVWFRFPFQHVITWT